VFKFVSKGDNHSNESALFYNGQRILTIHASVDTDNVSVVVLDGSDLVFAEWEDYLEDVD